MLILLDESSNVLTWVTRIRMWFGLTVGIVCRILIIYTKNMSCLYVCVVLHIFHVLSVISIYSH